MKTIYSPNLTPGEDTIAVCLYAFPPLRLARGGLAQAAEAVRRAGRFGDNLLVHINEREFKQLKDAWGEPHYNPETGLPEYFDWLGAVKAVAPIVTGLFSKKAAIDQANANPAPPMDPNLTTHLGTVTGGKSYIPQPKVNDPSQYYTYGQKGGETQFFKNNGLGYMNVTPGAQVQPVRQSTPSTASMIGTGLVGGALDYALKHPDKVASWFGKGGVDASAQGTGALSDAAIGASLDNPTLAGDISGLASAVPSVGEAAQAAWAAPTAESLGAAAPQFTMAGAVPGAMDAGAAGAADAAGALPGMGGGASWTAGSAAAPEAAAGGSGTAGAGLGATLGGVGMGLGALGAAYGLSRVLANQGHKTPADMAHSLAGATASARDAYNAATKSGDPNARAMAWQRLQQASQGYASYLSMLGPAEQAKAKQIYAEFGQKLPDFYISYLKAHNNPGAGKAFARGGRAHRFDAGGAVNAGALPMSPAGMSPTQLGQFIPPPGSNPGMFTAQPPTGGAGSARPPMLGGFGPGGQPRAMQPAPNNGNTLSRMTPWMGGQPNVMPTRPGMMPFQRPTPWNSNLHHMDTNTFRDGGHVSGPGSGRSDDIPARLSDGEYVIDAETTALLGDGSAKAGAAKLDHMRRQIRAHKGGALVKGRFTPAAKSPLDYMGEES